MAHNFRLVGDYYVSKGGSDSNDGLTPDTPFKTIQHAMTFSARGIVIVVGAGAYNEAFSSEGLETTLAADGNVLMDGLNVNSMTNLQPGLIFDGFEIRNYVSIQYGTHNFSASARASEFRNCSLKSCSLSYGGQVGKTYENTVLVNCALTATAGGNRLEYAILVGVTFGSHLWVVVENTYVHGDTDTIIGSETNLTSGVRYNDIRGNIQVSGDAFGLTDLATFLSNYAATYPNLLTNIDLDPLFNDLTKYDFSVINGSPLLEGGISGSNIAAVNEGNSVYAGIDSEIDSPAIKINLTGTSDLIVGGSGDEGLLRTNIIDIDSGTLRNLETMQYIGGLFFNKDDAPNTITNQDVPDSSTYYAGTSGISLNTGANPDRLAYKMRWATSATAPIVDADWDNAGFIPAGNFAEFEWNTLPLIDNEGHGNGEPEFNAGLSIQLYASYIQLEIILTNDYI